MSSIPPLGRSLILFVAFAVFFQTILFFKSNFDSPPTTLNSGSRIIHSPNLGPSSSRWNDSAKNRHPTVPLSLKALQELDQLAETIAKAEAERVFENKEIGRIHGSRIKNNPLLAKKIRDQIQCWTTHGSWQRQNHGFSGIKHGGDSLFTKCDRDFIKSLDRKGDGHHLGEFDDANDRLLVREAVKYKWVPDESICGPGSGPKMMGLEDDRAKYQPFTKSKFCQAIGRRDLLIVGDLTQFQLHDLFLSAFETSIVCYGDLSCLHHNAHRLCQNVALKYARNDLLTVPWAVDPENEEYPSSLTVEQPWATPDMLLKYRVLILNRGLIWRPDETFLNELVFTMKYLWKNYPDTLIIYRATHPVANNCTQIKNMGEDEAIADKFGNSIKEGVFLQKPLQSAPKLYDVHEDLKEVYLPTLADIQRQNKIAKEIVEAAGGIFLDTEAMYGMRPDGRMGEGDCARFCAPGPLDAYADLLYNTFRILQV
ncbi:hypothetical protein BGZ46_001643 [Entomortierella lignicola]|nr:hypothetical protein BGZ46_001643 [Entomortierella lignicola]